MSRRRVTFSTVRYKPEGPYSEGEHVFTVAVEWQDMAGYHDADAPFVPNGGLDASIVDGHARVYYRWDEPDPSEWWKPYLKAKRVVADGVWEYTVVTPCVE